MLRPLIATNAWAQDRYDDDEAFYTSKCNQFLREKDLDEEADAEDTLKFLLDKGANVCARTSDSQTVLHLAMLNGLLSVLKALMSQFDFTIDNFKFLNQDGWTPLHAAIHEEHIECLELLMEACPPDNWHAILDSKKNNILMLLCRFSDVNYGAGGEGRTLGALTKILKTVDEQKMEEILTQENDEGHNVLCLASMYGCFHEVKALTEVRMGVDRSIANKCGSHGASLLELAIQTKRCLEESAKYKHKSKRRDLVL